MWKLLQSLKLYFVFIRYSVVGFASFIIDISVFVLIYLPTHYKFYALLIGRAISGVFNFYFNKYLVYHSLNKSVTKREGLYYFCVAIVIFALSYTAITQLSSHFRIDVIIAKIVVDMMLFLTNFVIQKQLFKYGAMTTLKGAADNSLG